MTPVSSSKRCCYGLLTVDFEISRVHVKHTTCDETVHSRIRAKRLGETDVCLSTRISWQSMIYDERRPSRGQPACEKCQAEASLMYTVCAVRRNNVAYGIRRSRPEGRCRIWNLSSCYVRNIVHEFGNTFTPDSIVCIVAELIVTATIYGILSAIRELTYVTARSGVWNVVCKLADTCGRVYQITVLSRMTQRLKWWDRLDVFRSMLNRSTSALTAPSC